MITLIIDTSHSILAIGLANEEKVIDSYQEVIKKQHSELLIPEIDKLLTRNGLTVEDIGKIVVTEGPGSYTGTRIGITFTKVFAIGHPKVKIYTINTLISLIGANDGFAFIDARSKRVFGAIITNGEIKDERVYSIDEITDLNLQMFGDVHLLNGQEVSYPSIINNIFDSKKSWNEVSQVDTLVPQYLK